MQTILRDSPRSGEPADPRWAELERWTLEACLLRAEGREGEAVRVLQERIPGLIRAWSVAAGLARPVVQERLRTMFAEAQEFVARGLAQRRLITAELAARSGAVRPSSVAAPAGPGRLGLRQTVPVDDVVGMLDGLAEAEREARRERLWPARSAATLAAARL